MADGTPVPANALPSSDELGAVALSVIVVNRNTAGLLVDCLDHVFRSELECAPQVIVVDNGSTDDSVAQVRQRFPDALVIEAGRNLGFAAANNRAILHANGKYLLLVNTDAMLEPDCAVRLLTLMQNNPHVGLAGPQLLNADGTRQTSFEAVPTLATETLNRALLKRLFPQRFPGRHHAPTGPEPVDALIGAVMMIRKAALEEVGGFDESYFFFLEETDLAVRLRGHGWKVLHEPRARAVHLQGGTAKNYHSGARIEFYRSRYTFFEKHYGKASRNVLAVALTANLTLNAIVLGAANLATLGRVANLRARFRVRADLWKWHLCGCPAGPGLPRD
ncbi:MAG: glycosyltransferase family 2 protein [Desulfomonile sp.]|nr:glycosyltransferase family 2 protein [Desulfomonile sp.]